MAVPAADRTARFFLLSDDLRLQKELPWKWLKYSAATAAPGSAALLGEIRAGLAALTASTNSLVAECAQQQLANVDAWIAQQSAPRATRNARGTAPTSVLSAADVMEQPMAVLNAALPR